MRCPLQSLSLNDMLPTSGVNSMKTAVVAILAIGVSGFAVAEANGQIATPAGKCVDTVRGCGPAAPAGDGGAKARAEAAAEAERISREEARLGTLAAEQGATAFARGEFKAAAIAYLSAMRHQPNNADYRKKRAAALLALSRQNGTQLLDDVRGTGGGDGFDGSRNSPGDRFSLLTVKPPPTFSDTLFRNLELSVDRTQPPNVTEPLAMSQVEYMVKYNANALRSDGQIPPNPEALEKSVAALNKVLEPVVPKGTAPVTVQKVEEAYTGYLLGLKVKK
jgi:hypothetical protein